MHYQWFKLARGYFAQPEDNLTLSEFKEKIHQEFQKYPVWTQQAMMNVGASHDAPRLLTSFYNKNKYKYLCKPQEDRFYKTQLPDEETYHRVRLYLLHQFTFVGAPHIWNGDEMGMTGADDPDCRKPLVWPDIPFDVETASEFSGYSSEYRPQFDSEIFQYYKSLIKLRKSSKAFVYGSYEFVDLGEEDQILAYIRQHKEQKYWVVFNCQPSEKNIPMPESNFLLKKVWSYKEPKLRGHTLIMPPFSGIVLRESSLASGKAG
jgi:glycosidase